MRPSSWSYVAAFCWTIAGVIGLIANPHGSWRQDIILSTLFLILAQLEKSKED